MTSYTGTTEDRLTAVREAIDRCLTAQAYTIRGQNKQSAELASLFRMEKELIDRLESESGGASMASVGRYIRPR